MNHLSPWEDRGKVANLCVFFPLVENVSTGREVVLLEHLLMQNELLGLQNSLVFLHPWRSLGCFPSMSRAVTLHCIRSYESCFRSS